MAIRIEPNDEIVFGLMADGPVTATHARFQKTGGTATVKRLISDITAAVNEELYIPANMLDQIFPAGDYPNGLMDEILSPYFSGQSINIDLMTDSTTVVDDSGYSRQTYSDWQLSQESD